MPVAALIIPHFALRMSLLDQPELDGLPLVLTSPPNSRTVVADCTPEAARQGVRPSMLLREVTALCPDAVFIALPWSERQSIDACIDAFMNLPVAIHLAPERIMDLCDTPGATYCFRVTGTAEGIAWGTDVYTGDSMLAVAALHAGAVQDQETAVVKVTVMPPLAQYSGSDRNGVTTHDFGRFGTAFKVERV